jgi:ribosome-binding protein aMBF1 (putative translation factor)
MSVSEQQYRTTLASARRLEEALAQLQDGAQRRDPLLQHAFRDSIEGELYARYRLATEYERERGLDSSLIERDGRIDLPSALIRARIAAGLTQADLAAKLGVSEEQVNMWEESRYFDVSLDRLSAILAALGLRLEMKSVAQPA